LLINLRLRSLKDLAELPAETFSPATTVHDYLEGTSQREIFLFLPLAAKLTAQFLVIRRPRKQTAGEAGSADK
jgi:hypothetical protein